ncbi:hypothetical protein ACFVUS_24705 [Nocardia sp. NPDC058058]|uniref:effector-associated constant component EACC1 n=1 Tax=Nocardia sp. NPDC058058 TaxID=3346317 RepID=UPI0036DA0868
MSEPNSDIGSHRESAVPEIEVEFFVHREDSLGVHFWADDGTDNELWTDIRTRATSSGNSATFDDAYLLRGSTEPALATELLLGALGAGGAITMLIQILRDWVGRYRIKSLNVQLPDGTHFQITDASIETVERLFVAIGAHHPETPPPDSSSN